MRSRVRTLTLWTGTLLCVLIAAAFVVSVRWQVAFQFPTSHGPAMYIMAGSVMVTNDKLMSVPVSADTHLWGLDRCNSWEFTRFRGVTILESPLYAAFLAVLLPTLAVWRFVPKFPPGHCRCGYDLRGNVSGRCPECGTRIAWSTGL